MIDILPYMVDSLPSSGLQGIFLLARGWSWDGNRKPRCDGALVWKVAISDFRPAWFQEVAVTFSRLRSEPCGVSSCGKVRVPWSSRSSLSLCVANKGTTYHSADLALQGEKLERKGRTTSLCHSLRTTIPLEQASEIDRQPDDVRGSDNARHLRMADVV